MAEYVPLSEVAKASDPRWRKPRKPRKRKTYVEVFFEASIAGSMLRTLHMRGAMPQADFMTLYHMRCKRENPSRSSFASNFQRYVRMENLYDSVRVYNQPLGCLDRYQVRHVHGGDHIAVAWGASMPVLPEMLATLDDKALTKAENTLERIFTRDDDSESRGYLEALRAEMCARSKRIPGDIKADFATVAMWLHKNGSRFGDWYDNGAELDNLVPPMTGDVLKAWEHIRAVAESWDMTVLELLDADQIRRVTS